MRRPAGPVMRLPGAFGLSRAGAHRPNGRYPRTRAFSGS